MARSNQRTRPVWRGRPTPDRSDRSAGFDIDHETFERFSQVDDVFNRAFWDPTVRSDNTDRFYAGYREPAGAASYLGFPKTRS